MGQRGNEGLTLIQLANMTSYELNAEWLKERRKLEEKSKDSLTPNEKNILILAIFYTTPQ